MKHLLEGIFNPKDVENKGISKYMWRHMLRLGYIVEANGDYKLGKDLPNERQLKLEIAKSNYDERFPNKVRNRGVSKDDMNEWLEIIFQQDGHFPLHDLMKHMQVKNTRYLMTSLVELEYVKSTQRKGTEILLTEYDLDLIYDTYIKAVKNHTKKYKKPKRTYNSIYEKYSN